MSLEKSAEEPAFPLQPTASDDVEALSISPSMTIPLEHSIETNEIRPKQPPRPLSLQQRNQSTLEEVFPSIESSIIKAVLVASGGQLDPAFNALLSMSDPSANEQPPLQPPRPLTNPVASPTQSSSIPLEAITTTPRDQLDADALYAQRLQEQYVGVSQRPRQSSNRERVAPIQRHKNDDSDNDDYYYDSDKDHSFFDDDLPVIKENIKKGFIETQTKVNSWFMDFKKRIDGDSSDNSPQSSLHPGVHSSRNLKSETREYDSRNPKPRDGGYDADPKVFSDDFTHLELKDTVGNGKDIPPRRQKANPNLFQPSSPKRPSKSHNVSFEERPLTISDDDLYKSSTQKHTSLSSKRNRSPNTSNKWEPLKNTNPAPMERDPFSLGDSDDEKDGLIKESESQKTKSVTGPQESGVTNMTP